MADWIAARKYAASGSPLLLIGTGVAGVLSSLRVISHTRALEVLAVVIIGGLTQFVLSRRKTSQ